MGSDIEKSKPLLEHIELKKYLEFLQEFEKYQFRGGKEALHTCCLDAVETTLGLMYGLKLSEVTVPDVDEEVTETEKDKNVRINKAKDDHFRAVMAKAVVPEDENRKAELFSGFKLLDIVPLAVAEYVTQYKRLAKVLDTSTIGDEVIRKGFVRGIKNTAFRHRIENLTEELDWAQTAITTLKQAKIVQEAIQISEPYVSKKEPVQREQPRPRSRAREDRYVPHREPDRQPRRAPASYDDQGKRPRTDDRRYSRSGEIRQRKCYNCGSDAHQHRDCPKPILRCSQCHFIGHTADTCPGKRTGCFVMSDGRSAPIVPLMIGDTKVKALLDSGASRNFIDSRVADALCAKQEPFVASVKTANGKAQTKARVTLVAQLDGGGHLANTIKFSHQYLVMDNLGHEVILGFPSMSELGIIQFRILKEDEFVQQENDDGDLEMFSESKEQEVRAETKVWMERFPDLFGDITPESSRLLPFDIELTDDVIPTTPPRRLREDQKLALNEQVQKWLEQGVIETSTAPFCSPTVIVGKRTGGLRICLDFRKLNALTRPMVHTLPKIDDLVSRVEGMNKVATLDLSQAFLQVDLTDKSKELTAFMAPSGKYQFRRMPFGLRNAAVQMQKALEVVLGGLVYFACLIYIDDILIVGKTEEEYNQNVVKVLTRLRDAGIKLNPKKCNFGLTEVDYLGWRISAKGKRISPDRTQPIRDLRAPKSKDEIRALLGLMNYFRIFVPQYAEIVDPIQRGVTAATFSWTDEQQMALDEVKKILLDDRQLYHLVPDAEIRLYTDASSVGVGGVLTQVIDGKLVPIAYFSHALSTTQKRWSTYEQEAFGVVYCMKKAGNVLRGQHFTVYTDHRNLLYIEDSDNAKVTRWRIALAQYDFDVQHIPGSTNGVADALSRLVVYSTEAEETQHPMTCWHNGERGHFGVDTTIRMIKAEGKAWDGMWKEVKEFISKCPVCQKLQPNRVRDSKQYSSLQLRPFETVQLDTIGPLTEHRGKKYIIVFVDVFSKLTELIPVHSTGAKEAADALLHFMATYGKPRILQSDNGSQFANQVIAQLTARARLKHRFSIPYHPQGMGIVERQNGEVMRHLRALLLENPQLGWTDTLAHVKMILNNTVHAATGFSPFEILFSANDDGSGLDQMELEPDERKMLRDFKDATQLVQDSVRAKIRDQQKAQEVANTEKKDRELTAGGYALVRYAKVPSKVNSKWRGPLQILDYHKSEVKLKDLATDKVIRVHHDRVIPFYTVLTHAAVVEFATRGTNLYMVEKIIGHRQRGSKVELLVDWVGYERSEATWEPFNKDNDNLEELDEYTNRYPAVKAILAKARRWK